MTVCLSENLELLFTARHADVLFLAALGTRRSINGLPFPKRVPDGVDDRDIGSRITFLTVSGFLPQLITRWLCIYRKVRIKGMPQFRSDHA